MRLVIKGLIIASALLGACVIAAFAYFYWAFSVERSCSNVVTYGIGSISPGHKLSDSQILAALRAAEKAFETKYGGDVLVYREKDQDIRIDIKYDEYYQRVVSTVESFNDYYEDHSGEYSRAVAELEPLQAQYEQDRATFNALRHEYEMQKLVLESAKEARSKGDISEDEYDTVYAKTEAARVSALNAGQEVNALSAEIQKKVDQINTRVAIAGQVQSDAKLSQEVIDSNNIPNAFSLWPKPNSMVVDVEYFADSEQLTKIVASAFATIVKPEGFNIKNDLLEITPLHKLFGIESSDLVFEVCRI